MQHPSFNIGIITGARSGLAVVDVDFGEVGIWGKQMVPYDPSVWKRKGPPDFIENGFESWKRLQMLHGAAQFKTPLQSRSPNGGIHHFFNYHPDAPQGSNCLDDRGLRRIDGESDGGSIVAPPSRVFSKGGTLKQYKWRWKGNGPLPKDYFCHLSDFPTGVIEERKRIDTEKQNKRDLDRYLRERDRAEREAWNDDDVDTPKKKWKPRASTVLDWMRTDHKGPLQSGRNKTLMIIAWKLVTRFSHLSETEMEEILQDWNETECDPPKPMTEVRGVLINSLAKFGDCERTEN